MNDNCGVVGVGVDSTDESETSLLSDLQTVDVADLDLRTLVLIASKIACHHIKYARVRVLKIIFIQRSMVWKTRT